MNTASQNIRYLRRKYQFTQEQMARKLGIKRSLLGAYEEARANPRLEVLVKAAELFNVSVDQLVSDTIGDTIGESPAAPIKDAFDSRRQVKHRESAHKDFLFEETTFVKDKQEGAAIDQYKSPYLPPRKIEIPASSVSKSLQRLRLVSEKEGKHYFFNAVEQQYLESLPELILPLPSAVNAQYRAFEVKDDAMQPISRGAIVVGRRIENILELKDGKPHILVTRTEGILFRRVYNHIEGRGNLLLEANHKAYAPISLSVLGREVEAWEGILYLSSSEEIFQSIPEEKHQSMGLPQLSRMVFELQQEVRYLKEKRS